MNDLVLAFADLEYLSVQLATTATELRLPTSFLNPHGDWLGSGSVTTALTESNQHLARCAEYAAADLERIGAFPLLAARELAETDAGLSDPHLGPSD